MSTPVIPPRPSQRMERVAAENDAAKLPEIPAQPVNKRSMSPANYSPLLDPYHLGRKKSVDPVQRPPSVSRFPTSGEEGMEYGEIQYQPVNPSSVLAADAAAQTRNVASDLQLHAPKPSLPTTSATAQVQAVTRTDSTTAAAHGIGRSNSQEGESLGRIRSRASFSRPDSAASGERRRSVYADEHEHVSSGVGIRVPINPLLGDVQAPSPAPGLSPHHTGDKKRHHQRTKSGREVLPPGSYGLHGHGIASENKFERDWYAKHPDQLQHEEGQGHGVYESIGSGRGAFAMSSDDLNKIVRDTAARGHGFGTTSGVMSYPDEQIGYTASEQYISRNATPTLHKVLSSEESPTRKSSDPAEDSASPVLSRTVTREDNAVEPDDVHVDAPTRKFNKITGGEGTLKDKDEVKPYASHPASGDRTYAVPILADDEVAKELGSDTLQPALFPASQNYRRGSGYDDNDHGSPHTSRPSSRPGSIYQMHSASHSLTRFLSHHEVEHTHTPLEDVDEYEPLFPEDDGKKKEITVAERFKKRPETVRHKFPSQDIWEDTPHSAMYETTVSTPDLPETERATKPSYFEPPEAEAARKGETSEAEKKKLIPVEQQLAKSKFAPHLRDDMPTRPGMQPRFPSRDIWEDSPDSQNLVATVNGSDDSDTADEADTKPSVPARPSKSRLGDGASSAQIAPSLTPNIPARPEKKVHAVPPADAQLTDTSIPPGGLKKVPSIPDKPKPQIPVRPARKPDSETLTKVISGGSAESPDAERSVATAPVAKAKPQVPARPAGNKIASLRSNFMNDLNQKLGLGPPKEKEAEVAAEAEEAKPLEDARKGRARGPQRRAPAKSPSSTAAPTSSFSISLPRTIFTIDNHDSLLVSTLKAQSRMTEDKIVQMQHSTIADTPMPAPVDTTSEPEPSSKSELEEEKAIDEGPQAVAPSLATNTAGESVDPGTIPAESHKQVAGGVTAEDVSNANAPSELVAESDVDYNKLEEKTASADGKGHATEAGI